MTMQYRLLAYGITQFSIQLVIEEIKDRKVVDDLLQRVEIQIRGDEFLV